MIEKKKTTAQVVGSPSTNRLFEIDGSKNNIRSDFTVRERARVCVGILGKIRQMSF